MFDGCELRASSVIVVPTRRGSFCSGLDGTGARHTYADRMAHSQGGANGLPEPPSPKTHTTNEFEGTLMLL